MCANGPSFPIAKLADTPRLVPKTFTIKVLTPIIYGIWIPLKYPINSAIPEPIAPGPT